MLCHGSWLRYGVSVRFVAMRGVLSGSLQEGSTVVFLPEHILPTPLRASVYEATQRLVIEIG